MWSPFPPEQQTILTRAAEHGESKVVLQMGGRSCVVPIPTATGDDIQAQSECPVRQAPSPPTASFAGMESLPHERRLQNTRSFAARQAQADAARRSNDESTELTAREWLDTIRRGWGACGEATPDTTHLFPRLSTSPRTPEISFCSFWGRRILL